MGMAASQARLLALTSRMHDIELRAQNIQNQKLELANREDAVYEKYCEALDATKIQVGYLGDDYKTHYMDACYANVCGFQPGNQMQYSLIDNRTGKVIVPQEIKDLYDSGDYNDKYTFAMAAIGIDEGQAGWTTGDFGSDGPVSDIFIGIGTNNSIPCDNISGYHSGTQPGCGDDLFMSEVEFLVFDYYYSEGKYPQLNSKYDALLEACQDSNTSQAEKKKLLNEFRDLLYKNCGDEIFKLMCLNKNEVPAGAYFGPTEGFIGDPDGTPYTPADTDYIYDFEDVNGQMSYYANLFDQIKSAGGCTTIDAEYMSGEEGVEWFKNAVNSGVVGIYMLNTNNNKGWQVTTIATSVSNNYLKEVTDDDAAKKAEAEYEHELKIINRKDAKFDNELKKLETEETACKTEIESLKSVIENNIQNTFKIFS